MNLVSLLNAFSMAFGQLWRNRGRSALTSLGILIGVAAVIAMVGLGQGATASIQSDLSSFGTNMLMVESGTGRGPQARTEAPPLDLEDAEAIAARVPNLAAVAPTVNAAATAFADGAEWATSVRGTTESWLQVSGRSLSTGRAFTEGESRAGAAVCVIGETLREELFGEREALGQKLRVGKVQCQVIGVLTAQGEDTMGNDRDDLVVMPIRAVQRRLVGSSDVGSIMVSARRAQDLDQVQADLDALMRERRHIAGDASVDFTIRDTREMAQMMSGITGTLTAFLTAVAGVSLVVGGIGIMNMMLVSVTERTREIGIRMAIGALESDIRTQFLVEAAVLAGFGGVLGAVFGIAGIVAGATALGLPVIVSPLVVGVAVGFSALMGVGFGWVPARRAARLEPIDALRHS
ncbi:MAG: ABC transporter permease [Pseudomonadota bacterium]|nr:ABC transporter permease [Pseudomonadota bacterium]